MFEIFSTVYLGIGLAIWIHQAFRDYPKILEIFKQEDGFRLSVGDSAFALICAFVIVFSGIVSLMFSLLIWPINIFIKKNKTLDT